MARERVEQISCDLCGYGGPYTRPQDFVRRGPIDLCRWCARGDVPEWIESGGCRVTFEGLLWTCSCGVVSPLPWLAIPAEVRIHVPEPTLALAYMHLNGKTVVA